MNRNVTADETSSGDRYCCQRPWLAEISATLMMDGVVFYLFHT